MDVFEVFKKRVAFSLIVAMIVALVFHWIATLTVLFTVVWILSLAFLLLTFGSTFVFFYFLESSETDRRLEPK